MKLLPPRELACPECKLPFAPRAGRHALDCSIKSRYKIPEGVYGTHQVLVFGSRNVPVDMVSSALTVLDTLLGMHPDMSVLHGNAKGADTLADHWAQAAGVAREIWEPQWTLLGRYTAPFWRNQEMALRYPQEAVGFIGPCEKQGCHTGGLHGSHGSMDMAARLQAEGILLTPFVWGGLAAPNWAEFI